MLFGFVGRLTWQKGAGPSFGGTPSLGNDLLLKLSEGLVFCVF